MITPEKIWDKIFDAAEKREGKIEVSDFVSICLYDDAFGYYKADRRRAGGDGADFYTSASLKNKVFGELIKCAVRNIFAQNGIGEDGYEFVEIGAEPYNSIIENTRAIRLGDEISVPEKCVLISNELLDARPFSRFVFSGGKWNKVFLEPKKIGGVFSCSETFGGISGGESEILRKYFPRAKVEGFKTDLSLDAMKLFDSICAQNWRGAFVFADYFRTAAELSEMPNGTARTYSQHKYGGEIWENAGQTDITYSPCSDIFGDIALARGFSNFCAEPQEVFCMRNAAQKIEEIISAPNPFDSRKRELAQLISPIHMGASFRIMSAVRF